MKHEEKLPEFRQFVNLVLRGHTFVHNVFNLTICSKIIYIYCWNKDTDKNIFINFLFIIKTDTKNASFFSHGLNNLNFNSIWFIFQILLKLGMQIHHLQMSYLQDIMYLKKSNSILQRNLRKKGTTGNKLNKFLLYVSK